MRDRSFARVDLLPRTTVIGTKAYAPIRFRFYRCGAQQTSIHLPITDTISIIGHGEINMSRATFVLIGALALTLGAGSPVIAEDDRQDVFDACVADGSAREDCCRASGGTFRSASRLAFSLTSVRRTKRLRRRSHPLHRTKRSPIIEDGRPAKAVRAGRRFAVQYPGLSLAAGHLRQTRCSQRFLFSSVVTNAGNSGPAHKTSKSSLRMAPSSGPLVKTGKRRQAINE